MSKSKQKPIDHVKDFNLTVAIWRHENKDGETYYQISPTERRYKDDQGEYQSSTSLSGTQILQSSRLQDLAYARIRELEAADYAASHPSPVQD